MNNELTVNDYLDNLEIDKQNIINRILDNNVIIDNNATFTDIPTKLDEVYNNALDTCIDSTFINVPQSDTYGYVKNGWIECIDKIPENLIFYSPEYCFQDFKGPRLPQKYTFSQNKITSLQGFCNYCAGLDTINIDLTNYNCEIATMANTFSGCENVISISITGIDDFSFLTNTRYMFQNCKKLINFPDIDMSNVTEAYSMFYGCEGMEQLPTWVNTSLLTSLSSFLSYCTKLKSIHLLDCSKVTDTSSFLFKCESLTDIEGFKDLGKAFDNTKGANYYNYYVDLRDAKNLTLDSLYKVITNLYDIKSMGCKPQSFILSYYYIHKSEIPDEYINLLVSKGWELVYS